VNPTGGQQSVRRSGSQVVSGSAIRQSVGRPVSLLACEGSCVREPSRPERTVFMVRPLMLRVRVRLQEAARASAAAQQEKAAELLRRQKEEQAAEAARAKAAEEVRATTTPPHATRVGDTLSRQMRLGLVVRIPFSQTVARTQSNQ
jgi:hypothetical protein